MIDNPAKVNEKKKISREHVLNNYSWDTIADQMEELYFQYSGDKMEFIHPLLEKELGRQYNQLLD